MNFIKCEEHHLTTTLILKKWDCVHNPRNRDIFTIDCNSCFNSFVMNDIYINSLDIITFNFNSYYCKNCINKINK